MEFLLELILDVTVGSIGEEDAPKWLQIIGRILIVPIMILLIAMGPWVIYLGITRNEIITMIAGVGITLLIVLMTIALIRKLREIDRSQRGAKEKKRMESSTGKEKHKA